MKAMRGRIALQKHFVRNPMEAPFTVSRQLSECVRVLAARCALRMFRLAPLAGRGLR